MNLYGVTVPEIITQQSVEELRTKLFITLDGLSEPIRVFFGGAPKSGKTALWNILMCAMHDLDASTISSVPNPPGTAKLTRAAVHKNLHFLEAGGLGCQTEGEIQLLMKIIRGVDLDALAPIAERDVDNVQAISAALAVKNTERVDLVLWVIDLRAEYVVGLEDVFLDVAAAVKSTNVPTVVVTQTDHQTGDGVQNYHPTHRKAFVKLGEPRNHKRDFISLLLIQDLISQAHPNIIN